MDRKGPRTDSSTVGLHAGYGSETLAIRRGRDWDKGDDRFFFGFSVFLFFCFFVSLFFGFAFFFFSSRHVSTVIRDGIRERRDPKGSVVKMMMLMMVSKLDWWMRVAVEGSMNRG